MGGVVQAGEPLMLIVPDSDTLIVDAKVAPQDIDQIHVGQHAVLRFAAFNQRTTPEVDGEVIHIGADVTQDDKATEPYYSVRIGFPTAGSPACRAAAAGRHAGRGLHRDHATHRGSFLVKPLSDQLARAFRGR